MSEFRVVLIRPEPTAGIVTKLQTALEVNDDDGYELHTLTTFKDGLLAVFVRPDDDDIGSGRVRVSTS